VLRDPDVALIAPYPRLGVRHGGHSGVASYSANLARALDAAGARVTVVAPIEEGEPAVTNDGRVSVRRSFRYGPRGASRALRAAAATGAPVVHLQHELFLYGGPAAVPPLLAALAAAAPRHPRTVVTMHQVVDPADVTAEYTRMHRIAAPAPVARLGIRTVQSAIRALSHAVIVHERAFTETIPGAVTVPHGMEPPPSIDRQGARSDLGLDERPVALCFGFLAPYKGLEVAGEAARHAGDAVQVVFAGGPHPRLEARHGYAAQLRTRYGEHVRFPGYVPDEEVHKWFAAADVAVLPYPSPHASSGPLALAIAHGTPILASRQMARICGLPPQFAFTDADDLARRLRELAGDRAIAEGARHAVADLRAERSWDAVASRHLQIYDFAKAA
jgi:glycosyltransferase involved in cell wall biosynthesis